jgi:hypothetical protein
MSWRCRTADRRECDARSCRNEDVALSHTYALIWTSSTIAATVKFNLIATIACAPADPACMMSSYLWRYIHVQIA